MHLDFTGSDLDAVLADAAARLGVAPDWAAFPQMWSSTALGFGGAGGAMMSTAVTVIAWRGRQAEVYFGKRHAYSTTSPHVREWISAQRAPSVWEATSEAPATPQNGEGDE